MDIRWLLRDGKNFLDFVPILEACKLDKLYQTDFMRSLTHEYWTNYQKKILYRALLPWMVWSVMSMYYFATVLSKDYEGEVFWQVYAGVLGLLTVYELQIEVR